MDRRERETVIPLKLSSDKSETGIKNQSHPLPEVQSSHCRRVMLDGVMEQRDRGGIM